MYHSHFPVFYRRIFFLSSVVIQHSLCNGLRLLLLASIYVISDFYKHKFNSTVGIQESGLEVASKAAEEEISREGAFTPGTHAEKLPQLRVIAHACVLRTWEVDTGRLPLAQGQPGL